MPARSNVTLATWYEPPASIVESAALGAGAAAWFGGDATVDRLFVAGSQGQSAVQFAARADVDNLVVEGTTGGPAVLVGSAPTRLRGLQVTGNAGAGLVVRGPVGDGPVGGPHLVELSTLADNGAASLVSESTK